MSMKTAEGLVIITFALLCTFLLIFPVLISTPVSTADEATCATVSPPLIPAAITPGAFPPVIGGSEANTIQRFDNITDTPPISVPGIVEHSLNFHSEGSSVHIADTSTGNVGKDRGADAAHAHNDGVQNKRYDSIILYAQGIDHDVFQATMVLRARLWS
jgi:hypothetical protein